MLQKFPNIQHIVSILYFNFFAFLAYSSYGFQQIVAHHVIFHLPDNTPANHNVGNVLHAIRINRSFARAMLSPDDIFAISDNGDLYTRYALDRDMMCGRLQCCEEDFCQFTIQTLLFDSGANPMNIQVNITIADENDNAPKFPATKERDASDDQPVWVLTIPESAAVGTTYALPAATDADSPRFGVRNYKLFLSEENVTPMDADFDSHSLPFSLDPSPASAKGTLSDLAPKLRVNQPLDRELREVYILQLVAEDAGSPPLRSSLVIQVKLLDVNDNLPTFTEPAPSELTTNVSEDIAVGTVIKKFTAKDKDSGNNGKVTYSIDWSASNPGLVPSDIRKLSTKYVINAETGELKVAQPLDYEDKVERRLLIVVKASDSGSPSLTASTTLTAVLSDVNDNDPEVEIKEVSEPTRPFALNLSKPMALYENDPEPRLLKLISVSDKDGVSNGRLSCELAEQHTLRGDFTLKRFSPTVYGLLNNQAFDFEKDVNQNGCLQVSLVCTDSAEPKRFRYEVIEIPLGDTNDNWPQFSKANYQFYVSEAVQIGTEIGQIFATDRDSGLGGQITYDISSEKIENLNFVAIDPQSGRIYTTNRLDREKFERLEYRVTATDAGEPWRADEGLEIKRSATDSMKPKFKTNTTGLSIIVLDVNDNPPAYHGSTELHLPENAPTGTEILNASAFSDLDRGSNGTVSIFFAGMPFHDLLYLEDASLKGMGKDNAGIQIENGRRLISKGLIDREKHPKLIFSVVAKDHGPVVRLSTTVTFTLLIDDLNDNRPYLIHPANASLLQGIKHRLPWSNDISEISIPADTPNGTVITTIKAEDPDEGVNGTVIFRLIRGAVKSFSLRLIYHKLDFNYPDEYREYDQAAAQNGYDYFRVDEISGQIMTSWGDRSSHLVANEVKKNGENKGDSTPTSGPPKPGIYYVIVELTDQGSPPLSSQAIFYLNVSEAVGDGLFIRWFGGTSMSNSVMLILVMVCSLALTTSLVAAVFWVRYRRNRGIRRNTNRRNASANCNPTILSASRNAAGYFYPTNYPPVDCSNHLADAERGFILPGECKFSEKEVELRSSWRNSAFDVFPFNEFEWDIYEENTIVRTIKPISESNSKNGEEASEYEGTYPLIRDTVVVPVEVSTRRLVEGKERIPEAISSYNSTAYSADPVFLVPSDINYAHFSQADSVMYGIAVNNSTGGSDSGVDSGAGGVGPPGSSSPIPECCKYLRPTTSRSGVVFISDTVQPNTYSSNPPDLISCSHIQAMLLISKENKLLEEFTNSLQRVSAGNLPTGGSRGMRSLLTFGGTRKNARQDDKHGTLGNLR
ncbi:unnamed protein product [Calicophoron daubneyi]|uniref:Cadherin domain-containing protein n=1 Tax=Calicophoron daubneyi TaxID=300641 RepID=A0AAV2TMT4_CALDB